MSDLKLEIGEAQIQNAIAVAVAESFSGEKRDALLRDIIRAHLSVKQNSYDKETLLAKTVGTMIREYARECLESEIQKLKPRIAEVVRQSLGPGFEEEVCAQLVRGLAHRKVMGISVSVSVEEDE
jgi:ATP-dependent Lon protease